MIDLGAVGKGYAIERAAGLLRAAGVTSALLHGGTSTVQAIGSPPDAEHWKVALEQSGNGAEGVPDALALKDEALSVSAVWGRSFQLEGRTLGHVLDPRTGRPVSGAVMSAVVLPSATDTDALSTALLVLGEAGMDRLAGMRPESRLLIEGMKDGQYFAKTHRMDSLSNTPVAKLQKPDYF